MADRKRCCCNCGAKMDDNVIQHTESVGNALGALDEVEKLSRYIDANKMADELSKVPWYERKDEKQAVRMVKEFPAADVVEVRHGQWNGGATGWECSVCSIESNNTYPHCPYCGAVMDGGQDDV